ncbi:hypothetical protein MMUR_29030 [Mycolicibacterium murale]|uniref:DUF3263 domain-containing protein n=1 Tax=Mycolicibacterium murale TaxID=182220 RepID=A0A7I9WNH7_9MYCO|nr:hypothetical protein [Mycolicibacterium murale]MCV7185932.1 hypothetical protein [Mycolicibacterium murale]GFG58767.1 hypothetical protein MMUR_29030 [Mycolicibacterium murale]
MTSTALPRFHEPDADQTDQRSEVARAESAQEAPNQSPMRLDRYERAMLSFYVRWAPYGGPPEAEVFPEFGLSLGQMLDRVQEIIASRGVYALSAEDLRLMHLARCVALRRGRAGSAVHAPAGAALASHCTATSPSGHGREPFVAHASSLAVNPNSGDRLGDVKTERLCAPLHFSDS